MGGLKTLKPSKITPGFNLLWESSRIMLPEHIDMLQRMKREKQKKKKPEFDEQYLEELSMKIYQAKQEGDTVVVTVFDEYEDVKITGIITSLDTQLKRIKIVNEMDNEPNWIPFYDILEVEKI